MEKNSSYLEQVFGPQKLGNLLVRAFKTRSLVLITIMLSSVVTYRYFTPENRGYLSLLTSILTSVTAFSFTVEARAKGSGKFKNGASTPLVLVAYLIRLATVFLAVIVFTLAGIINFEIFGLSDLNHVYLISILILFSMAISPHNEVVVLGAENFSAADKFYTLRFLALAVTLSFFLMVDMTIFRYFILLTCVQTFLFSAHTWSLTRKYFWSHKQCLSTTHFNRI